MTWRGVHTACKSVRSSRGCAGHVNIMTLDVMLVIFLICTSFSRSDYSADFAGNEVAESECCYAANIPNISQFSLPVNMAFIIGAQKSGTTYLFDELVAKHPHIKARSKDGSSSFKFNSVKEPHLFNRMPLLWTHMMEYLKSYALAGSPQDRSLTFLDGTPDYMHIASSPCRLSKVFPDAKLIVVLRDPVQRALSQWNMIRTLSQKPPVKDFDLEVAGEIALLENHCCRLEESSDEEALEGDEAGLSDRSEPQQKSSKTLNPSARKRRNLSASHRRHLSTAWNDCFKCTFWCGNYTGPLRLSFKDIKPFKSRAPPNTCTQVFGPHAIVRRGFYAYQLEWWLHHFKPEQFLIIDHNELLDKSQTTLRRVVKFLGHDPELLQEPPEEVKKEIVLSHQPEKAAGKEWVLSTGGWSIPRNKSVDNQYAEAIHRLNEYYKPANERLRSLLNSVWPKSSGAQRDAAWRFLN
ncbi:hypothetical protein CEUSTIGMA_g4485.t1 [Chlamydomonas eustigma]|uniref:Sulfotransferase n=1 Tax=Chlamydomonas eustigma TaxID=1157962 RepID=A0A250X1T9_9CHLO|nr:hypothetical protein CEUSTIGMA_g4485.t1 [Chlamydomonas eustigma]|eukprot:GAX77038.1 hypothetical protein CEUSTIGMA_g4485.t1 [Chlamydomonas eustigma]